MSETMTVWLAETGYYEDRYVVGVYSTPQVAYDAVRQTYAHPYIVRWSDLQHAPSDFFPFSFSGDFEQVDNFSTKHTMHVDLRPVVVDDQRPSQIDTAVPTSAVSVDTHQQRADRKP